MSGKNLRGANILNSTVYMKKNNDKCHLKNPFLLNLVLLFLHIKGIHYVVNLTGSWYIRVSKLKIKHCSHVEQNMNHVSCFVKPIDLHHIRILSGFCQNV